MSICIQVLTEKVFKLKGRTSYGNPVHLDSHGTEAAVKIQLLFKASTYGLSKQTSSNSNNIANHIQQKLSQALEDYLSALDFPVISRRYKE